MLMACKDRNADRIQVPPLGYKPVPAYLVLVDWPYA